MLQGWSLWVFLLPVVGVFVSVLVNYLQYPYTNRFEVAHPECSKCGYDLTGTQSTECPECGSPVLLKQ